MLFMLTGDVQTGKTRWLERLVAELARDGVPCAGVIAPGMWRERAAGEPSGRRGLSGEGRFEKLGIENVLLPGGERVAFARRRDLAQAEGVFNPTSQSAAEGLAWEISEEAIERVNAHFATLASLQVCGGLLVVDELGRLELVRGGGLTEALALLDAGPTAAFPHAFIVVRAALADTAEARFASVWDACRRISPGDAARHVVRSAFGLAQ